MTLAHEALLSQWGRLRAWVQEARKDRLLGEELERDAARWRADPRLAPPWQKHRLVFGEELLRQGNARLSTAAAAFLKAGRRAERRSRLVGLGAAAVLLVGLVVAGAMGWRVLTAKWKADRQAEVEQTKNRGLIEQQARDRERTQKLERLIEELREARSEEQAKPLEDQIREVSAGGGERRRKVGGGAAPRAPTVEPSATAAPAASAAPSPSTSTPKPGLRPEKTWLD